MDQQLTKIEFTRGPFWFLPILGKPSLKSSEVMVLVNVVFAFLIGFKVLTLSVRWRCSRKNVSIYLVYFRLKLTNPVFYRLFLLGLGLIWRKTYVISKATLGVITPLSVPLLLCLQLVLNSGGPVSILGDNVFGGFQSFGVYLFCHWSYI